MVRFQSISRFPLKKLNDHKAFSWIKVKQVSTTHPSPRGAAFMIKYHRALTRSPRPVRAETPKNADFH